MRWFESCVEDEQLQADALPGHICEHLEDSQVGKLWLVLVLIQVPFGQLPEDLVEARDGLLALKLHLTGGLGRPCRAWGRNGARD